MFPVRQAKLRLHRMESSVRTKATTRVSIRSPNNLLDGPAKMISRLKAQILLAECTGRDIWSAEICRDKGVPEAWIAELADAHESGFTFDDETIYYEDRVVNQYHGIHDLLLARKLAGMLGVDVDRVRAMAVSETNEVRMLIEEANE